VRGLVSRPKSCLVERRLSNTKGGDIVPYFNYKLLDFPEHDTVFGTGRDPIFKDKNFIKAKWTPELRDAMHSATLELKCFHDGESLEGSLIGECRVDMRSLADGISISGSFSLRSTMDRGVGQVTDGRSDGLLINDQDLLHSPLHLKRVKVEKGILMFTTRVPVGCTITSLGHGMPFSLSWTAMRPL